MCLRGNGIRPTRTQRDRPAAGRGPAQPSRNRAPPDAAHHRNVSGYTVDALRDRAGRPLYEQLGFKPVGEVATATGHFTPNTAPPRIPTRPATIDDLPEIHRLDAEVFGIDRTNILAQMSWFADNIVVAESRSELIGYAIAWPNSGTRIIGPVIARDPATARALITHLATGPAPIRVNIDTHHRDLLTWLTTSGLAPTDRNTTMTYAIPDLPGDRTRRFAPLTLAAG